MIADALSPEHPFDAIVFYSFSRFFRDAVEYGMYKRKLRKAKVQLISITQPKSDDEAGDLVEQVLTAFDEYNSRENGKNTRRSMIENAQKGYFNGSRAPFGYVAMKTEAPGRSGFKRKLEIDAREAEVVRRIFALAISGDSGIPFGIKRIAQTLNDEGSTLRGKSWTRQKVWGIVESTTYYGEHVFNRFDTKNKVRRDQAEWVVTTVPALISKEEWLKAQALRAERAPCKRGSRHQAASAPTLLTGIATCAHCGRGFVLASGKGGQYDYYRCATRAYEGNKRCDAPNIPCEELDAVVLGTIAECVLRPERVEAMLRQMRDSISRMQAPDRDREKQLQREMAQTTERVNMMYDLVETGKLDLHESVRARITAMQRHMDAMTRELRDLGRRKQLPLKKIGDAQVAAFTQAIKTEILTPGSKFAKPYLSALVSEIRISAAGGTIKGSIADRRCPARC
jgi:DNA invertase Pin-like site-specific DNA recombinase